MAGFGVLIRITLISNLLLVFILPFDNYYTMFLTLALIPIIILSLTAETLQISILPEFEFAMLPGNI